jgi:hypothetical protein
MEIVLWVVVAVIALAAVYVCALNLWTRKAALGRDPARSDAAPQTKESTCRRDGTPMTTLPKRANSAGILFLVSFAAPYDGPRRPQTAIAKKKRGPR